MDTKLLIDKTFEVSAEFDKRGATYDKKERVLDLVEEVGELAQALLIVEGVKQTQDPKKQKTVVDIKDALCDILFALVHLAKSYDTDLFEEYMLMLDRLKARLDSGEFNKV
jgi:NTP pyrophosphatase (non-canonical NTP hydrolase)